jgi:hypothetical protein
MKKLLPVLFVAWGLAQLAAAACPAGHTEVRVSENIVPPKIDFSKISGHLSSASNSRRLLSSMWMQVTANAGRLSPWSTKWDTLRSIDR